MGAELALAVCDPETAIANIREVVRWRVANQPGGLNAGSVFTNPPGDSAGRLIDVAGLKGLRRGSAVVSDKHANFFQCDSHGSADDVRALIEDVRAAVAKSEGVELLTELCMVGFPDSDTAGLLTEGSTSGSTSTGGSRLDPPSTTSSNAPSTTSSTEALSAPPPSYSDDLPQPQGSSSTIGRGSGEGAR